jgi:hypothetical protein
MQLFYNDGSPLNDLEMSIIFNYTRKQIVLLQHKSRYQSQSKQQ